MRHSKLVDEDLDDRVVIETNGDITFYKDDGTTVTLLWDETDNQWEFENVVGTLVSYVFNFGGTLATGTGASELPMVVATRIVGIRARASTAPTDDDIILDVDKNNVTVFTTQGNRTTIADGAKDSGTGTLPDITDFAAGDYLSVNVDQIGSTIAGSDLVVHVLMKLI